MGDLDDDDELKLVYEPTKEDYVARAPRGQGRVKDSNFLAITVYQGKRTGYLVHGNSQVKVMRLGADVTGKYSTWRRWRIWRLGPGEGLNTDGLENDWEDDNLSGKANWLDIPGYDFLEPPEKWKPQRYLLEFAVGIEDHLDLGFLYFFVVVSLKPKQYKVQMSAGQTISFADWRALKASKWSNAKPSGLGFDVDSMWLTVK